MPGCPVPRSSSSPHVRLTSRPGRPCPRSRAGSARAPGLGTWDPQSSTGRALRTTRESCRGAGRSGISGRPGAASPPDANVGHDPAEARPRDRDTAALAPYPMSHGPRQEWITSCPTRPADSSLRTRTHGERARGEGTRLWGRRQPHAFARLAAPGGSLVRLTQRRTRLVSILAHV